MSLEQYIERDDEMNDLTELGMLGRTKINTTHFILLLLLLFISLDNIQDRLMIRPRYDDGHVSSYIDSSC
jgi:hypothetical protein